MEPKYHVLKIDGGGGNAIRKKKKEVANAVSGMRYISLSSSSVGEGGGELEKPVNGVMANYKVRVELKRGGEDSHADQKKRKL